MTNTTKRTTNRKSRETPGHLRPPTELFPGRRVFWLALSFVILLTPSGWAEETSTEQPWVQAGKRFGRGFHNTALGWAELPLGVGNIGEEHGFGAAATWGVLHGLGRAVQRTAVGVFELFTFPFALSEDDKPLIEPEYLFTEKPE